MTLVLFDIDGTLLNAHGLGRRTIEAALSEVAGRPVRSDGIPFAGRTDPAIAADMLRAAGFEESAVDDLLHKGLELYVQSMDELAREGDIEPLTGVPTLLNRLASRDDLHLALLTGNMRQSAFAKLRGAGLDTHFRFGAFGSDNADRYALPAVALDRARTEAGLDVDPADVVIIGDTIHDVGCGKQAGMRTVAVATGPVTLAALRAAGPDLLLSDFSDRTPLYQFLAR